MIPLRDDNQALRPPVVTTGLIVINVLVFIYQVMLSRQGELLFILEYGLVPGWLTGLAPMERPPEWLPSAVGLVTSQFIHGGFLHLAGNMLYLWIFGDNVEDYLGPWRFLAFYLGGGVLAALCHVAIEPGAQIPMIGASGAISAVLGAYLVLYPRTNVMVLLWFFVFVQVVRMPAILLLVIWFALQLLGAGGPGVAWMAHIGGFVVGLLLIRFIRPQPRVLH